MANITVRGDWKWLIRTASEMIQASQSLCQPLPANAKMCRVKREAVIMFQTLEDKQYLEPSIQAGLEDLVRTLLHKVMTAKTRVNKMEITA